MRRRKLDTYLLKHPDGTSEIIYHDVIASEHIYPDGRPVLYHLVDRSRGAWLALVPIMFWSLPIIVPVLIYRWMTGHNYHTPECNAASGRWCICKGKQMEGASYEQ